MPGTGINRFNQPYDVAVGLDGKVFVADLGNHRVQVYSSQLDYVDTIGITGNCLPQFDTLCDPSSVSVDAMGRVYISDQYPRIKVYDADGAYIATIGGVLNLGDGVQDFGGASGLAVDPNGLVYVADSWNHRVQVYTPLGNGWEQVNVSGFGILEHQVDALASFDGQLYAGGGGSEGFASLWRKDGDWVQITGGGFGMLNIHSFQSLYEYNGRLYAGTRSDENYGAQVWRSSTGAPGTWSQVVGGGFGGFGDPMNAEILSFAGFDGRVYASTASYTDTNGAEVWGSPSGDFSTWTQSGVHGFDGNSDNRAITSLQVHNLYLYASTTNEATGTEVWRSADGIVWSHVNLGGFGDVYNISANLASVDGTLYAGTYNYDGSDNPGGELWSCQVCDGTDWALVDKGFGDPENRNVEHVRLYNGMLYAFVANHETGLQIWTKTGESGWMQVNPDGFGDYQNRSTYYNNAVTDHFGNLYVGVQNFSHGGEIWMKFYEIFLPITVR